MEKICKHFELQYHFIEAINGKNLNQKTICKVYDKTKTIQHIGRELAYSEIGCALSHISIYKKIIDEGIDKAIILEDDIFIQEEYLSILDSLNTFPNNWELILLGHHRGSNKYKKIKPSFWDQTKITPKHKLVRPVQLAFGSYGYLLNYKGAKRLLKELSTFNKPIDHYTGDEEHINMYAILPSIIKLNHSLNMKSNIEKDRKEMEYIYQGEQSIKKNLTIRLLKELLRPPKRLFTHFIILLRQLKKIRKYT